MAELRSSVSVTKANAVTSLHILQLIHKSFLDLNYQTDAYWKVTDIKKIDALQLEYSFQCRKLEMEQERTPEELKEEYLFTCYKSDEHINVIAGQGLYVQQSKFNFLGDSLLGVILCKHADIQLKAAQNENQPKCWLMVFKVLCGRKLAVHPAGNVIRKPTEGADCHVSSIPPVLGETLGCQAIKSQVYLYEADPACVTGYSMRPRQCVPQAYVEFISCSAPGTSLPPMVHPPYPGIISHQRIVGSLSHHTPTSDLIHHNQRIPQNGAPVGCDIQLTRPAVSLGQKFPPYVPKSSGLRNRKRSVPVVSQPPSALPTYSSMVNFSHLNWQQLAAGAFAGEGSNNTSRIESNAGMVNSGHLGWQQLSTRPEDCNNPSRMEDNRLQVLLLNRTLVIELLQAFAKEMNTVAGVWRQSGCNVETTSCLKNAVLAVQELRVLFMQIAPVCQQFYKFAQDLFSGKTDNFPSLTVVQHQLKCLRTCQSTMSTSFKYFHDVMAQTTDTNQKGILVAQAVLSRQLLLLHCLTSLQGTLMAFNGFHTNSSGVVTEAHAKQNTSMSDLPVQNSAGMLYTSRQHSLPRQPDAPRTAPETTSTISPSLASLFAMSGGEIGQLSASSRQESVNSVCVRNNRAWELQRNDSPSNSDVRRICAERTMLCEREEARSDFCLAENSSFQFGLRLPIVIAPDNEVVDELVDEVVNMTSPVAATDAEFLPLLTSIKQEKTTSRDKRSIIETIFIDADDFIPKCIGLKNEEVGGDSSDMTRSSTTFGLVLDVLDEENPGTSLARVFCVSPDEMDESGPDDIQPCALSSSHTTKEQQSQAESQTEAVTTVEDYSSEQVLLTSDNVDFAPASKYDSFLGSSQSDEENSATENVEPQFVVNIEPTTEEPSDSEPDSSQNLNCHSPAENSNSQIIADPEVVPGLSSDVHDTLSTCAEKDSLQLENTYVTNTAEVDSVVQISLLKKKKCLRQKPKAFVKRKKSFFLRKFRNWTRSSYGRKKPTTSKQILTVKAKSVNRKCRAGKAFNKKGNCKQAKESETTDAGGVSAKVSNTERLQISETAEVVMPGRKKTDNFVTENLNVVDFPVTESQSQDSSSQDLSANTCISRGICTDTAHTDVSEKYIGPSLASSRDSDVAKTGDNMLESSFLITSVSACNSEATLGDEQPFQSMDNDIRANESGSALVCQKTFAESTHLPLRTAKFEPMVTDFDLADEQKPRFFENQEAVDDEIIAEVVANAAEFDGGNTDDSDDAGFLKIRIENVCSIAPEGFESMNYSTHIKTESEVNVEESTEHTGSGVTSSVCDISVKIQSSLKTEDTHDGFKDTEAIRMNDLASEVVADVGGSHCLIRNSEATSEVISVAQPTSLINASSCQAVAKEQTCQEEEIVDVGDAEYSTAIGQSLAKASVLKDRISDLVHGENFDDCDVEFDVRYENTSDEDEGEENERSDLSMGKGNAESEISDEVLKFYSLGGDNYETADVNSTLDLMTLGLKTAPTGSTVGAESGRKQVKKPKRNTSGGRKRRRKRRTLNAVKKGVKRKLPIENQESELVIPPEQNNEMVSERAVKSGKKKRNVEEIISPVSSETPTRKRFSRKPVQESNVNAFLVSADVEKLCCALPELGVDSTIPTDLEGKSAKNESTDFHDQALCSESRGPDLLEKETGNLELPKLDETLKADVQVTELKEGEANEDTEEKCEKDLPSVQDLHQIESVADSSPLEKSEATKTKKRKRRYAMTGRSKRRKRTASHQKMRKTVRKFHQITEKIDTDVDEVAASEQENDCKTDPTELLPLYDESKKCAEIPEVVLNLFVKGTPPVESIRTSPRRRAAVLCQLSESVKPDSSPVESIRTSPRRRVAVLSKQSESVKPNSSLQRVTKLCRKRRTSSKAVASSTPESTLLDMLNDDNFLETLKSAVKTVEGNSSMYENTSEPAVEVGSADGLQASVEESNPVYFTDIASTFQDDSETSKSSNVITEPVSATSENVDYFNCWQALSEEHMEVNSLGGSMGASSTPYSENDEVQTPHCSSLDRTVSAVSYSALINAVDSASSSISFDAIRRVLKTVSGSKGVAPNCSLETVDLHDHAAESLCPNSVVQLNISEKDTCSESAQSSFSNLLTSERAADTSATDTLVGGGCHSSAKTVIPLSVYLRNVRQSNYKIMKVTESNNEPAFYTGLVKAAPECPTYIANQGTPPGNQIQSRDPRLARLKQQSSVVQPLMQIEPQFPSNLPSTVLAHYSSVENIQEAELQKDMGVPSTVLTSPVQYGGSFPGYFRSFSNTESPINSNPVVKKPVCSITPFVHQSEKPIGNEEKGDSVPTVAPSKQDSETIPSKLFWDGNWQLVPISNLPPRPPIIFARLPLSERKIDGLPSDPRIRSERELSVLKQLSRPDHVCDDVPLVIDDTSANIKLRRSSGGVLSNANFVSKEGNNWEENADKAKDWFFQGKPQSGTGDVTKRSLSENLSSPVSKSKPAPADDILNDLLSSLHTESFEGERMKNMETGMLCGLNKDRVLGKRSGLFPKLGTTSDKQQQKHRSSVDGRSHVLARKNHDRDNSKRDRDHKSSDKPDQITANVHQRNGDKRSLSKTSSHRHHAKDDIHNRKDHSSRKDSHHRDSSRTRVDKSSQRSHVKPRLDVNSEDSHVSLISTDPANKATDAEEKRPNEECIKKRQHSTDEKSESADVRKRLKKSLSPSSCTHKDERQEHLKSVHRNKEDNLKLVSVTEKEKSKLEPKMHDTKTRESRDEALRREKRLKIHSSQVDNNSELCLKQHDKEHVSRSRDGWKSVDTVNEKSNHKDIGKSRRQSQGSSGSKERLHGQDDGKHLHRREDVEKRRLSHGDVKKRTNTKDGDSSKISYSAAKVRHELVQPPTAHSSFQQNLASTEDIHSCVNEGVDTEAKDINRHQSVNCAVEQLESNADTLSEVCGAGSLSAQDLNVDFTEAEEEHEDGSLVIHMEEASDKKDSKSHLDCILPPRSSCVRTNVHNVLKVSDNNEPEKNCMLPVSISSGTDEALPGDAKKLADVVAERVEPRPYYKACYEGGSCSVAPESNTQIRADILKSIRSLKLLLEDKLKSDVDVSDVCSESKRIENNSRTLSADGSRENSLELSNFSSVDLVGNLSEAEEKIYMLDLDDGSNPTQNNSSSDLSTKSDYSKSSFSSLASVHGTKSLVSSKFAKASENAFVTLDKLKSACAELRLEKSEFSNNSYQGHVNCGVPLSTEAASLDLPSEFPEIVEIDATESNYVTQEHVEDLTEENWKHHHSDQESTGHNLANVCGQVLFETQKTTVSEGETIDLTGIYAVSDIIDVEPDTVVAYSDAGEDKDADKMWETMEICGRHRPLSVICTSTENYEQNVLWINDDAEECITSEGTGKLLEIQLESHGEPSNSSGGSCTVNTRKVRAADFFDNVFGIENASDVINVESQNCFQLESGSHKVIKTESDTLVEGLQQANEIPLLGNMTETGDRCKADSSSDLPEPSCSSKPSISSRARRRSGRIADEWSNISSGWKELSRDHDEPADNDVTVVGISDCTELPSDISAEALAAYKEVFKKEIAMAEQKVIDSCFFIDPCDGLSECQIKKLLRINAANPEVEQELQLEYDILDLDKDVSKIQDCMEKIRNQLSQYRSPALDKTYDHVEQKFNFLLAKKEMYQFRLTTLRRYQKSHFVHVVPREFLFDEELEKYISLEGMLLFLHKPTISVQNCVRLTALKREIVHTRDVMAKTNVKQVEDVKRLVIKLRWLHLQRKVLLQQLCCTTEKGQQRLIQYLAEKLTWYKGLQSEIESTGDQHGEDEVHSFVFETINAFESYIRTLKSVQKSAADGRWTLGTMQTFKKRNHSRSSVESRNHDSVERRSSVKRRRQTEDVNFDCSDFEQSTSSRGSWRKGGNTSVYDQEDPLEDSRERWSVSRQLQRNAEFEGNRSRCERGQELTDFEDERGLNSRCGYRGGNSNDAWHEEGKCLWGCPETSGRCEQSSNMVQVRDKTQGRMALLGSWTEEEAYLPYVGVSFSEAEKASVEGRLKSDYRRTLVIIEKSDQERHENEGRRRKQQRRHSTKHVASVKARMSSGSRRFPVRVRKSDEERRRLRHKNHERSSRKWYSRPYFEDSSYARGWSGPDYSGRCARGWTQQHHY